MDSTIETINTKFAAKLSKLLPNLDELLEKHGVPKSDHFKVKLGIDLSELQPSLASQSTMSCYWDSSKKKFICSPTSPNEVQLNSAVESKLSDMLPGLGPVLEKHGVHGVLEAFTVNLGIVLSELASPGKISTMSCCVYADGRRICSPTYGP